MSTQRGRATSVMQLVGSRAKEALRAAEESLSKVEYQKNFELTKVKAQTIFAQVQESVAAKRGKSVDPCGKQRSKSAGPASKPGEEDLISKIMDALYGVSPVAARLALSKCEGIAKIHKIDVACNWLLEEKNRNEIEAAENEEIERSIVQNAPPSDVSGETPAYEELLPRARNRSPCKRRFSKGSDDGCGLGFFMTRKSLTPQKAGAFQPSPRKVPHPGRLSNRALSESARPRPSTGSVESGVGEDRPPLARRVSIGSQTSTASEEFHPAMTPRGGDGPEKDLSMPDEGQEGSKAGFQNPFLQRCEGDQDVQAMPPKEPQEETSAGRDDDEDAPVIEEESSESEDEDAMAPLMSDPLPPASQCWDWPLSRHEKKARVQMLERRMNAMDHLSLKKECKTLRGHLRKASMGGSSVASSRAPSVDPSGRPSRLSM